MPHDPKARVAYVDDWHYAFIPGLGPMAVRNVTYEDGTIEQRATKIRSQEEIDQQGDLPPEAGTLLPGETVNPQLASNWETHNREKTPPAQTPEQQEAARLENEARRRKANQESVEQAERDYNYNHPGPDGRRFSETNADRAARELREQADQRAEEARQQAARTEARQAEAAATSAQVAQGNLEVSRGQLGLAQQREAREASKPDFLSQANESNPYLIRYNPESGMVESMNNPNFDRVKQESERLRSMLAVQIQARQTTLDEAKQQYQQWYDTNIKVPMLQAQEARDRAAEQRAALDADERRRQFAASFSLQRGQLGERAGEAAMQAEQSLLPYRAGPTESAEMSSAINSLAAGGKVNGPDASAGIHFTPGAFEFNAPDFKSIARDAASAALKGISSYTPSKQSYQTADYSNVPAVSTSGAPSIPSGYGQFQGIIDQLKSTYQFGGAQG